MFFNFLFLTLVSNGCHDVREYSKLIEVPYFNSKLESLLDLRVVKFEDEGHTFQGITHELW